MSSPPASKRRRETENEKEEKDKEETDGEIVEEQMELSLNACEGSPSDSTYMYRGHKVVTAVDTDLDRNCRQEGGGLAETSKLFSSIIQLQRQRLSVMDIPLISTVDVMHVDVRLKGKMASMTVVDDQLFIVDEEDHVVKVYDSYTLTFQRRINIPDMKDPQGLAVCSHNKALYVSDSKLNCVHIVNIFDNFMKTTVKRWYIVEKYYSPYGLSVTSEHNLLVTVRYENAEIDTEDNSISRSEGNSNYDREIDDNDDRFSSDEMISCRVLEYTSEGQLVRDIELDRSIEKAWQTVKLSNDQFIICHGLSDSSLHSVCVINLEGQIIKSYGRERGKGEGQLNRPCSITIDNKRGHVFVSDSFNSRILMFNRDLILLGQVQPLDQLSQPACLYFDSSSQRLFIDNSRVVSARGMTVVGDQMFLVYDKRSFILVYDSYTLADQPRINIPDLKIPQSITGCSHNEALYISDWKLKCIRRVNLSDNSVKHWSVRENYEPWGLSLTSENNVLVTMSVDVTGLNSRKINSSSNIGKGETRTYSQEIGDGFLSIDDRTDYNDRSSENNNYNDNNSRGGNYSKSNVINCKSNVHGNNSNAAWRAVEYTSEGRLIREIQLDQSIKEARQTVQLSNDQFIICHGWSDSSLHRLCVINSEGQLINSYGGERGRGEGQLDSPCSITIDNTRGHVFVADCYNDRVLMYSRDLILLGQVQTRDHLSVPNSLYFDASSDRLFIGHTSDSVLISYSPELWVKKI